MKAIVILMAGFSMAAMANNPVEERLFVCRVKPTLTTTIDYSFFRPKNALSFTVQGSIYVVGPGSTRLLFRDVTIDTNAAGDLSAQLRVNNSDMAFEIKNGARPSGRIITGLGSTSMMCQK